MLNESIGSIFGEETQEKQQPEMNAVVLMEEIKKSYPNLPSEKDSNGNDYYFVRNPIRSGVGDNGSYYLINKTGVYNVDNFKWPRYGGSTEVVNKILNEPLSKWNYYKQLVGGVNVIDENWEGIRRINVQKVDFNNNTQVKMEALTDALHQVNEQIGKNIPIKPESEGISGYRKLMGKLNINPERLKASIERSKLLDEL